MKKTGTDVLFLKQS